MRRCQTLPISNRRRALNSWNPGIKGHLYLFDRVAAKQQMTREPVNDLPVITN